MRDQAEQLRRMAERFERPTVPPSSTPVVVIGSGKGGVGKSALTVMLGAAMTRAGRRVLLFDGAQNQANLHILLGVRPAVRLDAVLRGEAEPDQLLIEIAERLWLLPGDSGAESLYALTAVDRARLHHRLSSLYERFDAVIVDAGPGIESVVRVATMRATRLVVVAAPEPAALSDAYALIKIVSLQVPSLEVDVLVNRSLDEFEAEAAFERLSLAAHRFLRRDLRYLGCVAEDEGVRRGVREPGALLGEARVSVDAIAARLAPAAVEAR